MPSGIERAIQRGVAFLERTQLPDGEPPTMRWPAHDPAGAFHEPSVFCPATIIINIAHVPGTERIVARAADFIESHMLRFGLWRYSPKYGGGYPPDVDDTAIVSHALAVAGRPVPNNRHLLLANRDARGLFFTWFAPRLRWLREPRMVGVALARWRHPFVFYRTFRIATARQDDVDAVVNANVLFHFGRIPQTEPVIAYLVRVLREGQEAACDKWYPHRLVNLYAMSRALRRAGEDACGLLLARLRVTPAETPLEHACAASVLIDCRAPADAHLAAILETQMESGAWPRASIYGDPDAEWGSESMTTALCIEVLSRARTPA
jgi:hypothetical protein